MNSSEEDILYPKARLTIIGLIFILFFFNTNAQDLNYAKEIVNKLSSKNFYGRGYLKNGDVKTARFLRKELIRIDIKPLVKNYFQDYIFPVNIFPGQTYLSIDNKLLIPGKEFTIKPSSPSVYGSFDIIKYDTTAFYTNSPGINDKIAFLDTTGWGKQWIRFVTATKKNIPYKGIIQKTYKTPGTAVSIAKSNSITFYVNNKAIPENPSRVNIKIDSKIITHKALNVLGTIPGETDTFIVFTAHYDHLGGMGRKVYFPGANDNASGTAMVLDLARTLSKSVKHKYSYGFMFFSGEEAGLLGSEYYALNPVFPLKKIKIVINLDMVGTGADGISVFNGSSHPLEFAALDSINKTLNLGLNLKQRGPSQGSDHFAFHKRGIKALFLLTDDKNAPYHTITDTYNQLSFEAYERLFKLIQEYIKSL